MRSTASPQARPMNAPSAPLPGPLPRRTVLAGLLGMAATAPLGLARATTPAGAAAWNTADEPTLARLLDRVTWGNTAQGPQALPPQGVAAYPQEVTRQMVANFQSDGAAVNQICKGFDLGLKVFELALERPTRDITQDAALDEAECAATMAYGMEATEGCDILCVGEMGIGNTTPAAALACALFGGDAAEWVGRGTGVDDAGLARKAQVVAAGVALHAKPVVAAECSLRVNHGDLTALLYLQGYSCDDFAEP